MNEQEKPELDYRVENWPKDLQRELLFRIIFEYLRAKFTRELISPNFFEENYYFEIAYKTISKRFRVLH